jgi:hypothetical protein
MHVTVLWGKPSSTRQTVVWYSESGEESGVGEALHSSKKAQPSSSRREIFLDDRKFKKTILKTATTGLARILWTALA